MTHGVPRPVLVGNDVSYAHTLPDHALTELLFRRISARRGRSRLQQLLKNIKTEQKLPANAFNVSAGGDDLLETVWAAVQKGWLTEKALAQLVDDIEENGAQHIFLFNMTPVGLKALTAKRFNEAFESIPARPTPGQYTDVPASTRTYFSSRPDGLMIKQIFKAEYWERDEEKSYATADERGVITRRHERRAINLLRVHPEEGTAEIHIDRVRSEMDDTLALANLQKFINGLADLVDLPNHLENTPVWDAFAGMVADRDEIYLNADDAVDPGAHISLSNRKSRDRGPDIRTHPKYRLTGAENTRERLSPYWTVEGQEQRVFSNISIVESSPIGRCGKIYISATLEPKVLRYVLGRIRYFASSAS